MIKQLAHACIHADDLEKTRWFYVEVLGCEMGFEFIRTGELFGFYIKLGGNTFIEVFRGPPSEAGNIKHLAIQVDDMDGLIDRLKRHDVTVGEKKLGQDQSWQVWTEDPNGVRIEFHEYTPLSSQITGATCVLA